MERKHHSSNGFLFGVLLGVVITLLFTTKRGRNILSEFSESLLQMAENKFNLSEEDLYEDSEEVPEEQNGKKRIFKGVKKTNTK